MQAGGEEAGGEESHASADGGLLAGGAVGRQLPCAIAMWSRVAQECRLPCALEAGVGLPQEKFLFSSRHQNSR